MDGYNNASGAKPDKAMRFFENKHFSTGEIARLSQIVRPGGNSMILPYDQFIEHDNRHVSPNKLAGDPNYICDLAVDGGYNAVAIHYGLAKRYWSRFAGKVPLLLKLNGKTSFPESVEPFSAHTSYVEDAVRLGAVAVGYTMYYGSPLQSDDLPQLAAVREECDRYGMPLVVWAYPRGKDVDDKGGRDSSYAVESAVRMAVEMGASVIKANLPEAAKAASLDNPKVPDYYRNVERELLALPAKEQKWERARRVVEAAQGMPVLFSGGSQIGDADLFENAQACVDAGAFGFIFGRNMWKREKVAALEVTKKLQGMLDGQA
ncbi:fructose-bisphosphate aldolase [Candidatus Peregrinibacteria bacterium HGW-Peregrinibacteria-1]|jgi:class I fructose-bisphosphate aldolase|nr:MAG: fructose-bisphosphate aldolase [Candidatus Peregrinibacteria bacterium HGW-Peregrinibacteria-1]